MTRDDIVGLVLAAGAGTRLRPLTDERPKAMCPVGDLPLVDHALARVSPYAAELAVNVHGSQPTLREHVEGRAHVSMEEGERLATAGAVGHLHDWIDGRHVLLHNADSFHDDDLAALAAVSAVLPSRDDACAAADLVARSNGGSLLECDLVDGDARVVVSAPAQGSLARAMGSVLAGVPAPRATARAGRR